MSRHELTPEEKIYLGRLARWTRLRYMDYAKKKDLTYGQALNHLFRKNGSEQTKELDETVDPEFHSSKEPKQPEQNFVRNGH